MTEDRKAELAQMCRLEIRRTVTLALMSMSDYGYHFVETVFNSEFQAMMSRLSDKPVTDADIPTLRELVLDDLWPRLKAAHREHREVAFERLVAETNDIVVSDVEFAFDIGWIPLVRDAVERMRTYPAAWKVRLDGGKEKFGCLVLHVSFMVDERGAEPEIRRMREEIRLRSLARCDICGENGRLRLGGYAKTVCDRHAAVLGEMREDDGVWSDPWRWHNEQPLEDHIADVIATGRAVMAASDGEIADVQSGLNELDRWREEAESLRQHLVVIGHMLEDYKHRHMPKTAIFRQIERDIERNHGRKAEILLRFVGQIETAVVAAMSVADDDVDFWLRTEVDRWQCVQPVSDDEREFLHGYLRELIDAEFARIEAKAAERNED